MVNWVLIIVLGGFQGVRDVETFPMTERQCKAAIASFVPIRERFFRVECVGPDGEIFSLDDLGNN